MEVLSYSAIMDSLQTILPDKWKKVIYIAVFMESSYSMKCYAECGDGKFTDCFLLADRDSIRSAFSVIYDELQRVRSTLTEKELWHGFTMTVSDDGKFKAGFDYDDVGDSVVHKIQELKEKCIRNF